MQRAGFVLWILACGILIFDIENACVRAQDSSSKITTQEVDIVNASGATVIQLVNTSDGPTISLFDPNGHMRVAPGAVKDAGGLTFQDTGGNSVATLDSVDYKNVSQDNISLNPAGAASVSLLADSDYTGLSIADKSDKERATMFYDPKEDDAVFGTECAKDLTSISAAAWGKVPHLVFDDPKGAPRADFGVEANNNAYFALASEDAKASWEKVFDPDGSPSSLGENPGGSGGSNSGISDTIRRNGSS